VQQGCFESAVLHQSLLFAPSWRTVVSIPAKTVTASGQFFVEVVKHEIA
jgi:hypothetical protein